MSMRAVIESVEREIFGTSTKRNCGNCKWRADNEVCVNGNSEQVADFTSKNFSCDCHEFKENKNLKPCPFCGGEACILTRNRITFYVKCSKCYAMIDRICKTEEDAVELWNRRVCSCKKKEK